MDQPLVRDRVQLQACGLTVWCPLGPSQDCQLYQSTLSIGPVAYCLTLAGVFCLCFLAVTSPRPFVATASQLSGACKAGSSLQGGRGARITVWEVNFDVDFGIVCQVLVSIKSEYKGSRQDITISIPLAPLQGVPACPGLGIRLHAHMQNINTMVRNDVQLAVVVICSWTIQRRPKQ